MEERFNYEEFEDFPNENDYEEETNEVVQSIEVIYDSITSDTESVILVLVSLAIAIIISFFAPTVSIMSPSFDLEYCDLFLFSIKWGFVGVALVFSYILVSNALKDLIGK